MLLYQCQKTRDSRDNNVCSKYFSISEGGSKVGHPLPPPKYHKAVPSGTCNLICISHVLQQQAPFSLSCLCSARNNIQICSLGRLYVKELPPCLIEIFLPAL